MILTIDIGGTSVKYAAVTDGNLGKISSFETPKTWDEMVNQLRDVAQNFTNIDGVAISAPGVVKFKDGFISGNSAVPYIHHFPIVDTLEKLFKAPVTIENDANAAGLAEVKQGVAAGANSAIFVVVGTGVGGAVYLNGQLVRGAHGYGGEFGYSFFDGVNSQWSVKASAVEMARRYNVRHDTSLSGKELYDLAEKGDGVAKINVSRQLDSLARGIFNLMFIVDPDIIVIGGGLSQNADILNELNQRVSILIADVKGHITDMPVNIKAAQFGNSANLIGAYEVFKSYYPNVNEMKTKQV